MKLMIAGGGTGGHLFPGIAIAEEWQARGGEVLFVGSPRGLEKDLVPPNGFRLILVKTSLLKGGSLFEKTRTLIGLPLAFVRCCRILDQEKPDYVLGIGGYASGPMVLAACFKKINSSLIDQNTHPGFTNRILGRWVKKVFLAFGEAKTFFDPSKVHVVGNPVIKKRLPDGRKNDECHTLLVCGGSQGAHRINEVFTACARRIKKAFPFLKIVHQTGASDASWVQSEMERQGVESTVLAFIPDLEKYYAEVCLVIARAGAGTVTELALWGLPSILIPYPHAADDHQRKNAEVLVKRGAACLIDQRELNEDTLLKTVSILLSDPHHLSDMGEKGKELARPNAAKDIVDALMAG